MEKLTCGACEGDFDSSSVTKRVVTCEWCSDGEVVCCEAADRGFACNCRGKFKTVCERCDGEGSKTTFTCASCEGA